MEEPRGIILGMPDETYHAGPGVSKSMLWTLHSKTPAHMMYAERKETDDLDKGRAIHAAVLEPHLFDTRVKRGPADRRGNKWKEALDAAAGAILLTEDVFDGVIKLRDAIGRDPTVSALTRPGAIIEGSAYWQDEMTGETCRCRPDLWRPEINVMLDLKSCVDADTHTFTNSVAKYGYHAQDAWYRQGWERASEFRDADEPSGHVEHFLFLAVEKSAPYAFRLYELDYEARKEGEKVMRRALNTYAACRAANQWPSYGSGVSEITLPKWAFSTEEVPS